MQAHAIADDFRGNEESFGHLDACIDAENQQGMPPGAELDDGNDECGNQAHDGTQIGDDAEHSGHDSEQQSVFEPDERIANGQQCSDAHRHENLTAKEDDEAVVDGRQHEDQFLFDAGFVDRQVIGPVFVDALLLEQEIKDVDRHESKSSQQANPGSHPGQLSANPTKDGGSNFGDPRSDGVGQQRGATGQDRI